MKRSLPIVGQDVSGPEAQWRSLEEYAQGSVARAAEFPRGAAFAPEELSRRGFLQIMGASAALAGLAACKPPRQKIHPYVRPPEKAIFPGTAVPYATALAPGGHAVGLLVTTTDGRPTKVEGNPGHPSSLGAAGAHEQASLLDLYDPRRAKGFTRRGQPLAPRALLTELAALADAHAADGGARLRFLTGATSSPLLLDLRRRVLERFPKARFVAHESLARHGAREGARVAFGRPLEARYRLADAGVLVALDADFLAAGPEHLRLAREFASRRTPGERMSRLYAAEGHLSVTGAAADHRFRMRPSEVLPFARAIAAQLAREHGLAALAPLGQGVEPGREAAAVADDLARARGAAVVIAGDRQPPALHALAHALNAALGAAGKTVEHVAPAVQDEGGPAGLVELAAELREGKVDTLVVTAFDPVYTAPAEIDLAALLAKVPNVLYHAFREDETSARASWVLAASHPFESWGDVRALDGTVTIQQPLLQPLFVSLPEAELVAAFLPGEAEKGSFRLVQELWRARAGGAAFEARWARWLAAGVVEGTAAAAEAATPDVAAVARAVAAERPPTEGLEASFVPDPKLLDGRFAENAWLQELPDPLTKVTWDNAALVSPATARQLAVDTGSRVELRLRGRKVDAPVLVAPGHADGVVTLALGWGRQKAGPVGSGVGFDAGALRGAQAWFEGGLAVAPIGKRKHRFARTQEHFSLEGRGHALTFAAAEWQAHGTREVEHRRGPVPTIHEPVDYEKQKHKWGMAIDLAKCVGCSACVVACQAENNIPVVGKAQVMRSREMHWLRIDRYYEGTPEDPRSVAQPMMCQHCETAPCEYVCPVNATVHSDEGLNEMVYNRCVGTRYCSNNCPYKVRRFNFLDYTSGKAPTEKMLMNPDVTVRARGVMEKCTYCVQRIERARITARATSTDPGKEKLPEFTSACAQACPAQAIVFGDLKDPASAVARLHQDGRRYDVLHELGTRPRTAYLVRIRNPNPALES
jgi:molybdopterin-containing oxidoreductase family iron-sulfur binding subunit